jgi:hypothetical protein
MSNKVKVTGNRKATLSKGVVIDKYFSPGCDPKDNRCRFLNMAKQIVSRSPANIGTPAQFLTVYTPTEAKELMFGKALLGPIRNHVELVPANNQCVQAGIKFDSTTRCWLCGCLIGNEAKACEHIIPALRAIMFSGMITTKSITKDLRDRAGPDAFELLERVTANNYLWAHDNCNGSGGKGGMVLFKYNKESNAFVVDKEKCGSLREKIAILKREDCYKRDFGTNIFDNLVETINLRLRDINDEYHYFISLIPPENQHAGLQYYSEYTMEIIKIYASAEATELLLTEGERAEKNKANDRRIAEALAEQIRIQKEASASLEKNYEDYLRILKQMKDTEIESKGSVYHSIKEIGIELISRNLSAFYLQQGYKSSQPITLSLEINRVAVSVARRIEKVLLDVFPLLNGNITIISSLMDVIAVNTIFKLANENRLQMSIAPGRSGVINNIKKLSCDSFADLYINIVEQNRERLYNEKDTMVEPLSNRLFKIIVDILKTIDVNYNDCIDIITSRVSDHIQSLTRSPPSSPPASQVFTSEELESGKYLSQDSREHIQGSQDSQGSQGSNNYEVLSQDSGGGNFKKQKCGKIGNVTKKNKKTKKTKNRKSKKNRKVRNIRKTKKYNQ